MSVAPLLAALLLSSPMQQAGGGVAGSLDQPTETFEQILTPGDRGEFTLDMNAGDTVLALARSAVFDPALEIVGADESKPLATNDDIRPGDQRARILYRFTKQGRYKAIVKGFKSAAGGPFTLELSKFGTAELPLEKPYDTPNLTEIRWWVLHGQKGHPLAIAAETRQNANFRVLDPSGESLWPGNGTTVNAGWRSLTFTPEADGDYYVALGGAREEERTRVTAYEVPVRSLSEASPSLKLDIPAGRFIMADLNMKKGVMTQVSLKSSAWDGFIYAIGGEGFLDAARPSSLDPSYCLLPTRDSACRIIIGRTTAQPLSCEVLTVREFPNLGATGAAKLSMGSHQVLQFEGRPGQVMEIGASSNDFVPNLYLVRPTGYRDTISSPTPGRPRQAVVLGEAGMHYLVVGSQGNGGGGSCQLTRQVLEPKPIEMGKPISQDLEWGAVGVFALTGKKGQTIVASLQSEGFDGELTLRAPNGQQVAQDRGSGAGSDCLFAIKLPEDGVYTLWVSGGAGKYSVRWFGLDH